MIDKDTVKKLTNDYLNIKCDYQQYCKLFNNTNKKEEIEYIIDNTAPQFFSFLLNYFWERMIIGISRITDPIETNGNKNITISILINVAKEENLNCKNELIKMEKECKEKVGNIRKYRSKYYSHLDLKESELKKMKVEIEEIKSSFEVIESMLNIYYEEVEDSTWSFEVGIGDDIQSILYYLRNSLIYEELKDNRKNI